MNFNKEIIILRNKIDREKSTNWNKELFQLCSSIPLPVTTMVSVVSVK